MCRCLAVIMKKKKTDKKTKQNGHERHNHKKSEVHTWTTLAPSRCVMGSRRVVYMQSKLYSSESPWFTSFVWAKYNHTGQSHSSESPWFTSFVWAKYNHTGQSYSSESCWFTLFVWAKYNEKFHTFSSLTGTFSPN